MLHETGEPGLCCGDDIIIIWFKWLQTCAPSHHHLLIRQFSSFMKTRAAGARAAASRWRGVSLVDSSFLGEQKVSIRSKYNGVKHYAPIARMKEAKAGTWYHAIMATSEESGHLLHYFFLLKRVTLFSLCCTFDTGGLEVQKCPHPRK